MKMFPIVQSGSHGAANCPDLSPVEKDLRAPRYTSYPTADRFVEAFGPRDFQRHLSQRDVIRAGPPGLPLSIYVHIPFCRDLCYYCACNKTVTRQYSKVKPYLQAVLSELRLVKESLGGNQSVIQMHWGGGTPTYLHGADITELMAGLRGELDLDPNGEYSVEIDPRSVDPWKLQVLLEQGFNRISLGVQDFDTQVQAAIHRVQSVDEVAAVVEWARSLGIDSVNFDLIYGLPEQTVQRFDRTLDHVLDLAPDRVALYHYAHLPSRFRAQRLIPADRLPDPDTRRAIFARANERLEAAGYLYLGMDHYALPDDELARASQTGRLHRNFQGYSTLPDCDLVGLGASAISRVGSCYAQNIRGLNEYVDRLAQGELPTHRGVELSRDDIVRRAAIMTLMCQGDLDKQVFEVANLIDFDDYFCDELQTLLLYQEQGWLQLSRQRIVVTKEGRRVALRLIAAVFDRYLREREQRTAFSGVV